MTLVANQIVPPPKSVLSLVIAFNHPIQVVTKAGIGYLPLRLQDHSNL